MKFKTKSQILKYVLIFASLFLFLGCGQQEKKNSATVITINKDIVKYAKGFSINKLASGISIITVNKPWQNADRKFKYALIPKEQLATTTLNKNEYDAVIGVPINNIVVSSTTHIPALEELHVLDKLIGFPDTKYVSSKQARIKINQGSIKELGKNEALNTEAVLALQPALVVGFSISTDNATYETLERSKIPVVYNGDWVEETPLGKAEWIKFFAPFFQKEEMANRIFKEIETTYLALKEQSATAQKTPNVMSGAMYKDVWYLPGGKSWAATFLKDANANYLWKNKAENGSLSLSWENVLTKAQKAEYWVGPGQFTSYKDLKTASKHYAEFDAFKNQKIFTFSKTKGETGGMLYYELAPQRPDLVLKDLIHIFHPDILPNHEPFFFKPLD